MDVGDIRRLRGEMISCHKQHGSEEDKRQHQAFQRGQSDPKVEITEWY